MKRVLFFLTASLLVLVTALPLHAQADGDLKVFISVDIFQLMYAFAVMSL
jgi:hypothetical protein